MPPMRNFLNEAEEAVFGHRHPVTLPGASPDPQPQEQPQETHMTKLADARDAISALADNPLIDAITEAGIGKWMSAAEIQNLVSLYRDLENGRKLRAAGPPNT